MTVSAECWRIGTWHFAVPAPSEMCERYICVYSPICGVKPRSGAALAHECPCIEDDFSTARSLTLVVKNHSLVTARAGQATRHHLRAGRWARATRWLSSVFARSFEAVVSRRRSLGQQRSHECRPANDNHERLAPMTAPPYL